MNKQSGQLASILERDLGIGPEYQHVPKRVTPGEVIEAAGAVLKWYALYLRTALCRTR